MDNTVPGIQQKTSTQATLSLIPFSETFLTELVAEIETDQMRGIVLGGSHARGDATPYSDVDLACFVPDAFRPLHKRFLYREGHLVSLGLRTLEGIQQHLTDPYQALLDRAWFPASADLAR